MIAKLVAKEGQHDALVAAFAEVTPLVADGEPGTLIYAVHTDDNDPNAVWFYELYKDDAALAAHGGGEALKAVGPKLKGVLAAPPELMKMTPVGGTGLPS